MSLPRGVREVVVPSDQGRRGADVVVTDPAGDHVLPTFVATDGGTRARVRTHLGGDCSVRDLRGVRTLRAVAGRTERPPTAPVLHRTGRRLADEAGEPFFWLGDTWWFALCDRISESELRTLIRQRVRGGVFRRTGGRGSVSRGRGVLRARYAERPLVLAARLRRHRAALVGRRRPTAHHDHRVGPDAGRRRRLELLPAGHGSGADATPLARGDRALGGLPGGLVCGRRGGAAALRPAG